MSIFYKYTYVMYDITLNFEKKEDNSLKCNELSRMKYKLKKRDRNYKVL